MDAEKLRRLRERYAQADGDLKADVPFRDALKQFAGSELYQKAPYSDPPTLLDFPYSKNWEGLDTALVGVPMDLGSPTDQGRDLARGPCGQSSGWDPITPPIT